MSSFMVIQTLHLLVHFTLVKEDITVIKEVFTKINNGRKRYQILYTHGTISVALDTSLNESEFTLE